MRTTPPRTMSRYVQTAADQASVLKRVIGANLRGVKRREEALRSFTPFHAFLGLSYCIPMSTPLMPADRWGERLIRRLGLWSAVAVVIGSTIGSGIFRTPAGVAQKIDDVPLFLGAWGLGGVVAVCGALTYAELAAMFPRSGGIYVFLREAFGPVTAFLFGWAELLIIRPG